MGLVAAALLGSERLRGGLASPATIFSGGVVFPVVTLTILLAFGLHLIRVEGSDDPATVQIDIEGEQWWWRVRYRASDGREVETANEIRVPVGQPVQINLTTADVIHSFWIPELAGKVDMIPGRTNVLQFRPKEAGTYRGQCAEYCGGAHALMGIAAVAMQPEAFSQWMSNEKSVALSPESEAATRGHELFFQKGCPACHTITGTQAVGKLGPNLTHIASRRSLAAERLPMSQENLARWIRHSDRLKPGNKMPSFAELSQDEVNDIASYLISLK